MSVAGKKVSDFPQLSKEWDVNGNAGLLPNSVAAGSNKKIWWQCAAGHKFFASPNGRTNNRRESGGVSPCPNCGGLKYWTWDRIVLVAREIVEREGHLPSAGKLQASGYAMLVQYLYKNGKSWEDLREASGSFDTSSFVSSRSGLRWRSHPEASLSNFLFARGIRHEKGRKYPEDYATFSGKTYGYYDLHFSNKIGCLIDVEIWGDKPDGHNEAKYAKVRAGKEAYNKGRAAFLGIHYTDCQDDKKLAEILRPYIGAIEPHIFLKSHDPYLETTHWSNADELLETCRQIAVQQSDGKFPPEDWLRKRGRWADRDGPAYNTVSVYIKLWLGGTRKTRELLGQSEHSTIQWDRNTALLELRKWFDKYGRSPQAVRTDAKRGIVVVDSSEARHASNIAYAVRKYVGTMPQAVTILGITLSPRKRSPYKKRQPK